jgi:extracellular factor (EF) 3-hydroxypalmitic acid methyl ester biosynthesis protein
VQVSEVLNDLNIRSGDRSIYKGKAVVVSLLNTGLMAVVSVNLVDEWSDLGEFGSSPSNVGEEARRFVSGWYERFNVSPGYMVAVGEIRAFLAEVSRWTDQADLSKALPRRADGWLRADVFAELAEPVIRSAAEYFSQLEGEAGRVPTDGVDGYKAFAQTSLHPLVLRAPFVYRTFAKPLGYAGDYEMVRQILGDPQDGPTTYFQIVNSLFLASPVAQAHRNRIDVLVDRLSQTMRLSQEEGRTFKVLDIGCGPAAEIERVLRTDSLAARLEFTLVDFSEETLRSTKESLDRANSERAESSVLHYVNDSVHNLLKRATKQGEIPEAEKFDFVYCAGLFDYLSDKVCARLLEYLKSRTRPGGRILVTNVHPSNQQRGVMEHVLEWHLIYRDERQLASVLPPNRCAEKVFVDATGVNVFAEFLLPVSPQEKV